MPDFFFSNYYLLSVAAVIEEDNRRTENRLNSGERGERMDGDW